MLLQIQLEHMLGFGELMGAMQSTLLQDTAADLGSRLCHKGAPVHCQQVSALDGVRAQGCQVRQQGSQAQGDHLAVEVLG